MKLGIIGGAGNMGGAIAQRICSAQLPELDEIYISDINTKRCNELSSKIGATAIMKNEELASAADIIILAVKPNLANVIFKQICDVAADKAIISIMAGVSVKRMTEALPGARVLRCMPNMPALIGSGVSAICNNHNLTHLEYGITKKIFNQLGIYIEVDEWQIDAIVGLSGSSPAYFFIMLEAMADAGVLQGLPRDIAYKAAAQSMLGSAQLFLHRNIHPGALKDEITSPAGTTISAVASLEANQFRGTVMQAVIAAAEKSKEMGND